MSKVIRGLATGAVGTVALSLGERLETQLLGEEPVYTARRIMARLAARRGVRLSDRSSSTLGRVVRWAYGPALGVVRAALERSRGPRQRDSGTFGFAGALFAFELIVLPATGATPPLRAWKPAQVASLAVHTLIFSAGLTLARRASPA
jgi:hypothetical protein